MTDIVFRIIGDDGGVAPMFDRVDKTLAGLQQRTNVGAKAFAEFSKQTAFTRQESLALSYTMSDVAASLASGASPFTILLQQGGQVKDSFGGIGPLFSKLTAFITPARLAVGGLVGGLGALLFAAYEAEQRGNALAASVQLSGNYANVSAANFDRMTKSVAASAQATVGSSAEVLAALVRTGRVGSESIQSIATAALLYAKASGVSADEVVKNFATVTDGAAKWALEYNRQLNYLTVAQYQYLRQLDAQGRSEQAAKINAQLMTKALEDRKPVLTATGLLWKVIGDAVSKTAHAFDGLFNQQTKPERIDEMRTQLEGLRKELAAMGADSTTYAATALRKGIAQLESWLAANKAAGRQGAQEQAAQAEQTAQQLLTVQEGYQNAKISLERARFEKEQAEAQLRRDIEMTGLQRSFDEQRIQIGNFVKTKIRLETEAINAKEASVNKEIELEKRRPVGDPVQRFQQEQRVVELESKRLDIRRQRLALDEKVRLNQIQPENMERKLPETGLHLFREYEAADMESLRVGWARREADSEEAARYLTEQNRDMSLQLLKDDRERGAAQIAIEEEAVRKRLDLGVSAVAKFKRIDELESEGRLDEAERLRSQLTAGEEALAHWRELREQELTERLKPEWKRRLEGWQDTNRLMRESSEEFMDGFLQQGEDIFTKWATTGKLSAKSMVNFIESELARLAYKKYLSQSVASFGESLFGSLTSALGLGGGSSSGYTTVDYWGSGTNLTGGSLPTAGGLAGGGNARPYSTMWVGEKGPELLRMGSEGGTVTPNSAVDGGSQQNSFAFQIDARGADAGVAERIEEGVRRSVKLAIAGVAEKANRGGTYAKQLGRR